MSSLTSTKAHHGPAGLAEFAEACANDLLSKVQHKFNFPAESSLQHWRVKEIKHANEDFLRSLRNSGNVYAIFVREPSTRRASYDFARGGPSKFANLSCLGVTIPWSLVSPHLKGSWLI